MIVQNDSKKLTINSLKENICAIEYCLNYNKSTSDNWTDSVSGCLGIPTLILLTSIIDSIGSYFRDTSTTITVDGESKSINTASDHFLILNHDKLFNLNLTNKTIFNFYSKYRSTLTHNNTLPLNTSIDIGNETDDSFSIINDEIIQIRLKPLFSKIKIAVELFTYYLENANWSADHRLSQEMESKGNLLGTSITSISMTANTASNNTQKAN
jgi:hypothetical protein